MTILRVVLAEDEPLLLADMVRLLREEEGVEVVGEARNGIEALELIDRYQPDAVFLDIQMPGLDGLGVVAECDPVTPPAVVFVTAFDQYAVSAFDAHAVDYLLKPFDRERLHRAVERIRERVRLRAPGNRARLSAALVSIRGSGPQYLERIAARGVGRTFLLEVASIHWIEAADNYVRLHSLEGAHLSRRTMRDLEELLDPRYFARIHRSTIVALAQVRELRPLGDGDQQVILKSGSKLVLTRSYREAFEARFGGVF